MINDSKSIFNSNTKYQTVLCLWVFLLFLTGKNNQFVNWDDPKYVFNNDLVINASFENLGKLLKAVVVWNYHPITMFSLWLNVFLFGKGATPFIVINALFHALNTILIFKIASKLSNNQWVNFFTALFWGIHPMHVESVTWISERKDVLYALFFFLSILSYIKYIEQNNRKALVISILWFICSCFSKAMAVVLPLILLLIDYWFSRKIFTFKNLLIEKLPFWIIAISIGLLTLNVQGGGDLGGVLESQSLKSGAFKVEATWFERLYFASYGIVNYIFKLFIPINLRHWYPFPIEKNSTEMGMYIIGTLIVLGIIFDSISKHKIIFFGLVFFIISLILVLQLLPVGFAVLAERYTYVAYFGLIFMLFYLNQRFFDKKSFIVLSFLIAIVFSFISYKQIKTWKNTLTLWENAFQYQPNHKETTISLISEYRQNQNPEKIIETAQKAIDSGLEDVQIYQSLVNAQSNIQDYQGVLKNTNWIETNATPNDSINYQLLYLNKAMAYDNLGKKDSAMIYMSKAQQLLIAK